MKLKKVNFIRILLMIFILQTVSIPGYALASTQDISVEVDGIPVQFDVSPVIENGRTLVPFRAIAEALQVEVVWDGQSKSIRAGSERTSVELQIGNSVAQANSVPVALEVAPKIIKDRTFIPLRFLVRLFQADVKWDGAERRVSIQSPPTEMKVVSYYALGSTNGDTDLTSWTDLFGVPYPQISVGHGSCE